VSDDKCQHGIGPDVDETCDECCPDPIAEHLIRTGEFVPAGDGTYRRALPGERPPAPAGESGEASSFHEWLRGQTETNSPDKASFQAGRAVRERAGDAAWLEWWPDDVEWPHGIDPANDLNENLRIAFYAALKGRDGA